MKVLILFLTLRVVSPAFSEMIAEAPHQVWKVGERRWSAEEEENFARWGLRKCEMILSQMKTAFWKRGRGGREKKI
jgi:hypothetical protein